MSINHTLMKRLIIGQGMRGVGVRILVSFLKTQSTRRSRKENGRKIGEHLLCVLCALCV